MDLHQPLEQIARFPNHMLFASKLKKIRSRCARDDG
jgi:hypothetical protein